MNGRHNAGDTFAVALSAPRAAAKQSNRERYVPESPGSHSRTVSSLLYNRECEIVPVAAFVAGSEVVAADDDC
jgi:hypothetical protein